MSQNQISIPNEERIVHEHHNHLICWKSAIAGVFLSLVLFLLMSSLGAGVAGFTAEGLINKEDGGSALATGAGLWLGFSIVVSLFTGSYFSVRIARFMTSRIGSANGLVVASVFFAIITLGAGHLVGGIAESFGKAAKAASEGASGLASNPMVQDAINKSLANTTLKSEPADVLMGLSARLIEGDTESAKNYYAYQTGLAPAEVDAKVSQLKSEFDAAVKRAAEKTAHAVGDTGLMTFVVVLLGLIAAGIGGRTGARTNFQRPFAKVSQKVETNAQGFVGLRTERGSALPYIFGWLLGVPVSVLFLIAILRSIF